MRTVLILLSAVASGCLHATPMMTPETLPAGRTRVEAGFGSVPVQPSVRVRHGVTSRLEVGARVDVFALEEIGVTVGADAAVQLVRPGAAQGVGVVAGLGVSGTAVSSRRLVNGVGLYYAYPTLVVGRETLYGGARALVPLDRAGDLAMGAFAGARVPASSGASRHYMGIEVGVFARRDGVVVFPALTFGRRQNR